MSRKPRKPRSIVVIGRLWRDQVNGNNYCSHRILVDGICVHTKEFDYAQYEASACLWLRENGYLPSEDGDQFRYSLPSVPCRDNGIAYYTECTVVSRRRDLHRIDKFGCLATD